MESKTKRTITDVLDCETGECIDANEFFKKPIDEITVYRSILQQVIEGYREPLFTCYYCKQKIRIRGGVASPNKRKVEMFHFAHLKDSDECHIKTKNYYTREEVDRIKYNGAKESILHQTLKENIAECLRRNEETKKEVSSVEVEKVIRDKIAREWKKPDINAFFLDKRIALELQLSTTWLDVITRRQHFYKEQGFYIFWVFHNFDINDDVRKLTINDVVYTNNQNAYVFNKETYELSKSKNDLILKCIYKTYYKNGLTLGERWDNSFIKLSDLTFDDEEFKIYYQDVEAQKRIVEKEIENHISALNEAEKSRIIEAEKQKKKRQIRQSKIEELDKEIKKITSSKTKIKNEEDYEKIKQAILQEYLAKIDDYTDATIKYFSETGNYRNPFYNNYELLRYLKDEFEEQVLKAIQIIKETGNEQTVFTTTVLGLKKLTVKEVGGAKYTCIDNLINWDFIKKNYSQIKIIETNLVDDLFAEEELKPIRNEYDLNKLQYSKNYFFLIDFTTRISDVNEKIKNSQNIIAEQEKVIASVKIEMKNKLEAYLVKGINELKIKTEVFNEDLSKWEIELIKKEKELRSIEKQL